MFQQVVYPTISNHGGSVVDRAGDGLFLSFQSSTEAVKCALAIQRQIATRNKNVAGSKQIQLRIGVNVGDIIIDGERLVGDGVNIAARLETIAHPGGICISSSVRDHLREDVSATIHDLGYISVKNIARPIRVYRLEIDPDISSEPKSASVRQRPLEELSESWSDGQACNNLPHQLTSFVGRQRELDEVKRLLTSKRLLTLVGVAGIGKTRLALQLAAGVVDEYPAGVWFIDLAPIVDPALVVNVVAQALGIQEQAGQSVTQALLAHLGPRRVLLLLDNCEHVIDACARLVESIIHGARQVSLIATSREQLRIPGEQIYLLPSLSLASPTADLDVLARSDAVQLFLERARSRRPDFTMTAQLAPIIAQICTRLDGMPLALELAAARLDSMTLERIADRLNDRFQLLTGGSRTALPRQQTLRALIDWSYDLLDHIEATLFARLSVFPSGWTTEAAEAICLGGDIDRDRIFDLMSSLVQKSLVVMEDDDDRYRMLDSIRHYAQERLGESAESAALESRLVDYYLDLVESAEPALRKRSNEEAWLHRLDADYENIRLALKSSLKQQGAGYPALRICAALLNFWSVRGRWREGRQYSSESLAQAPHGTPEELRGRVLLTRAVMAFFLGEFDEAQISFEEALSIGRKTGNRILEAGALNMLGGIVLDRGDLAEAQALYQQAVAINREEGNYAWETIILGNLGYVLLAQGKPVEARVPLERALVLSRELGNPSLEANALSYLGVLAHRNGDLATASTLITQALEIFRARGAAAPSVEQVRLLGEIASARGDLATARTLFREVLTTCRDLSFRVGILRCLNSIVSLAVAAAHYEQATIFLGGRDTLAELIRTRPNAADLEGFEVSRERCRAALGVDCYEAQYQAGRTLPTNALLDKASAWLVM